MLTGLLLGLWLMMAIGRGTPIGRLLNRIMVELPLDPDPACRARFQR